jgi:calcineurin-like phosphoesterase family protein
MYRFIGAGLALIFVARLAAGSPTAAVAPGTVRTIIAAGDIASCDYSADSQTASLLDDERGTVVALGDNVYPNGSAAQYRDCYRPTWGRHLNRTRPAPGNHEYQTLNASGYFGYFGTRAGARGKGWYAYDRGTWRVYALNSNCTAVGGCRIGSPQQRWLAADLAAHPRDCVLAYWHHPYFSSGFHGNDTDVRGLWRTLQAAGAEVVLNGHDHDYGRFAPQTWHGLADSTHGIREFVVGTGGAALRPFDSIKPNSQVRNHTTHGVLRLRLHDGMYRWRFLSTGGVFSDAGTASCH